MRGRSLMLEEQSQLAWTSDDVPSIGSDEVLIETLISAVSIGTELDIAISDRR